MKRRFDSTDFLSIAILCLAATASIGGIFLKKLYTDTDVIKSAWLGSDLITLLVVVPMMFACLLYSRRGHNNADLLLLGCVGYMFYNYAFYLFGAAFNVFFLIYVAIFTLSIYTLVLGLMRLNIPTLTPDFVESPRRFWIISYLLLVALPLGMFELWQCLSYIFINQIPAAPPLIFALDLSLVIPTIFLAAVLLWKKRPWGFVLAVIMLVKGFCYGLGLVLSTLIVAMDHKSDPLLPFYIFICLGGLLCLFIIFRKSRPSSLLR